MPLLPLVDSPPVAVTLLYVYKVFFLEFYLGGLKNHTMTATQFWVREGSLPDSLY